MIWSAPSEYARSTRSPVIISNHSENHEVLLDTLPLCEKCEDQQCKERCVWGHGQSGTPVRCNLFPSGEWRKDWKSWGLVNYFVIIKAPRGIWMPACASYGSVCAEGSCGRFISTVVFCRLYIAPSRNLATGPNPMVATIMPKIVPEMKLNITCSSGEWEQAFLLQLEHRWSHYLC